MAVLSFFHHIGSFLLLAATVLLVITTISAPVVNNIGLLKVSLRNGTSGDRESTLSFGTFGYCLLDAADGNDYCTPSRIGYSPADALDDLVDASFSDAAADSARGLTKVMILHPVATGLCFIAFLLAISAGIIGSLLASLVSLLAFLVTAVALICDWVALAIVRRNVNDAADNSSSSSSRNSPRAYYSVALWTLLAGAICALLASIIVFLTCCAGRRNSRHRQEKEMAMASPPRRRRFGFGRRH